MGVPRSTVNAIELLVPPAGEVNVVPRDPTGAVAPIDITAVADVELATLTEFTETPLPDTSPVKALLRRREEAMLRWRGPAVMLFARAACAVGAQAIVAAVFALRASPTPWHDAEPWLPVYGTLIDAGCLALLWRLTRREGIRLFDLVGISKCAGVVRR